MMEEFENKIPILQETIPKASRIATYIYSRAILISILQHFTNGRELVRSGLTHFGTSFIALWCLHENKIALIKMFISDQWKNNKFVKTKYERLIEDVILDKKFSKNIFICLKAASPLIKVLQMVESKEKTTNHGVSLWAMDQVKGEIQEELNDVKVLICSYVYICLLFCLWSTSLDFKTKL